MKTSSLIPLFIGLAIGNFGYQFAGPENWQLAFDRTFFQGGALFAVAVIHFMNKEGWIAV